MEYLKLEYSAPCITVSTLWILVKESLK